ncbi:hypothetical protein PIB30_103705, partial [Stylosanthes scabra]|nr:hypothetical protein [Stylosanthes scabra]
CFQHSGIDSGTLESILRLQRHTKFKFSVPESILLYQNRFWLRLSSESIPGLSSDSGPFEA